MVDFAMMLDYWSVSHDVEVLGYICLYIYIYSFIFRTHQEFSDQTVACLGGKYVTKGEASVRPLELFMCSVVKRDLMVRSIESCWVDLSPLMVSTGKPTKNGTLKMSW
jgi:hypothetical protein